MSWKSFACMAALGAMASTAAAVPSIGIVDNLDGTGSIEITTTVDGALAAELDLVLSGGATLTGATINGTLFDDANPGDNPFIDGSPIGGDTTGLGLDLANNRLFASYGSGPLGIGTFTFLDFSYTGTGTGDAGGFVAQGGLLGADLNASSPLGDVVAPLPGDTEPDGDVDPADFAVLAGNWLSNPAPAPGGFMVGDFDNSGDVGPSDFALLAGNWLVGTGGSAVPEPTSAAMILGLAGVLAASKRRV